MENQLKCTISIGSKKQTVYLPLPVGVSGSVHTIRYEGEPKLNYILGEILDLSNLRFFVVSESGDEFEIQDPINDLVISADMNSIGEQEVKISYGATCSFNINVSSPMEINDIQIYREPDKKVYYLGEVLDLSGMIVYLRYKNIDTFTVIPLDQLVITGFDSSVLSSKIPITVSYNCDDQTYKDIFEIDVIDESSGDKDIVSITATVDDTYYYVHEKLLKSDVHVVGITKTGRSFNIPSESCSFFGFDSSKAVSSQTVVVSYVPDSSEFRSEFSLSIVDQRRYLIGFRIDKVPTKTKYEKGSTVVDLSGGEFSARYRLNNNDSKWIPISKRYVTASIDSEKLGSSYVSVVYGVDYSSRYEVLIVAKEDD